MTGWQDEPATSTTFFIAEPDRQEIAVSFAIKVALLCAIILAISALWAVTSQPAGGVVPADATLGPPIAPVQQAVTQE